MNADERDLILSLFDRISAATTRDNDPDAERLIRDAVARNPNAAYVLVQTVLLQEEALKRADERIREVESSRSYSSADESPRSFLGSSSRGAAVPGGGSVPSMGARQGAPSQSRQAVERPGAPASGRGGGFLSNALSTVGGVAGGMLLADGIRNLFGGAASNSIFGNTAEAKTPAEENTHASQAAEDAAQDEVQDAEFEQDEGYWDDGDGGFDI